MGRRGRGGWGENFFANLHGILRAIMFYAVTVFANLPCPRKRHEVVQCVCTSQLLVCQILLSLCKFFSESIVTKFIRRFYFCPCFSKAFKRIARDSRNTYRILFRPHFDYTAIRSGPFPHSCHAPCTLNFRPWLRFCSLIRFKK